MYIEKKYYIRTKLTNKLKNTRNEKKVPSNSIVCLYHVIM